MQTARVCTISHIQHTTHAVIYTHAHRGMRSARRLHSRDSVRAGGRRWVAYCRYAGTTRAYLVYAHSIGVGRRPGRGTTPVRNGTLIPRHELLRTTVHRAPVASSDHGGTSEAAWPRAKAREIRSSASRIDGTYDRSGKKKSCLWDFTRSGILTGRQMSRTLIVRDAVVRPGGSSRGVIVIVTV